MTSNTARLITLAAGAWAALVSLAWWLADRRISICGAAACELRATATRDDILVWGLGVALGAGLLVAIVWNGADARARWAGRLIIVGPRARWPQRFREHWQSAVGIASVLAAITLFVAMNIRATGSEASEEATEEPAMEEPTEEVAMEWQGQPADSSDAPMVESDPAQQDDATDDPDATYEGPMEEASDAPMAEFYGE